jgi:hypothetical protein
MPKGYCEILEEDAFQVLRTELNLHSYFSGYNGSLRCLEFAALLETNRKEVDRKDEDF